MDNKKEKRPTKKGLINEIETLDSNKVFNLLSLTRTNIDNLIAVRDLSKKLTVAFLCFFTTFLPAES